MGWLHSHQWVAWTVAGVVTVAGVGLTLFTGGGSDVVAGSADAAILGGDAAVTTAAGTTDIVAAGSAGVALTTAGNSVEFTAAAVSDPGLLAEIDQIEAFANSSLTSNAPLALTGQ
jgi:hypothetical protein